jgi:hypothetical protein
MERHSMTAIVEPEEDDEEVRATKFYKHARVTSLPHLPLWRALGALPLLSLEG